MYNRTWKHVFFPDHFKPVVLFCPGGGSAFFSATIKALLVWQRGYIRPFEPFSLNPLGFAGPGRACPSPQKGVDWPVCARRPKGSCRRIAT